MADDSVAVVHSLGRRDIALAHPKLIQHRVDYSKATSAGSIQASPALPSVGEAFIALGTTIKDAGSQQAFRAIDFDAVLAVAKAARLAGAKRLGVVSAMGADPNSRVFYNRVKGEIEQALATLGFDTLVIARPSILAGDRAALGQPVRSGEKLAMKISRLLAPVIPDNYKSIEAAKVARALLHAVPRVQGKQVLLSGQMRSAQTVRPAAS
ncbi:MAG: nucleoside-diphosphate sugar epimerase [Ramlibacter sp.]|nr:nucleoside-diphosphate sugar epimerase [Ramlibacter sp.]